MRKILRSFFDTLKELLQQLFFVMGSAVCKKVYFLQGKSTYVPFVSKIRDKYRIRSFRFLGEAFQIV